MGMFDWAEKPASVLQQGGIIAPDERLPWPQTGAMGVQHVIAMFGSTVLAPILMGFDPNIAILMSGIGTFIFFLVTGGKVPSYLGSSFAFIGVVIAATAYAGKGPNANIAVALGGIVLLVLNEVRMAPLHGPAGGNVPIGLALTAGAILAASSANVMQAAEAARRQPILTMLAWALAWGALGDCIVAWLISGPPLLPADIRYWGGFFYLGILGSVVTFPLYFQLVRELGPGRAAYNGVVVPIVAMLLSTLFEAYRWSLLAGCGAALALLGMVLALKARNPSR